MEVIVKLKILQYYIMDQKYIIDQNTKMLQKKLSTTLEQLNDPGFANGVEHTIPTPHLTMTLKKPTEYNKDIQETRHSIDELGEINKSVRILIKLLTKKMALIDEVLELLNYRNNTPPVETQRRRSNSLSYGGQKRKTKRRRNTK